MLQKISATFRFRNWWDSKIPPLLAIVYFKILISDSEFSIHLLFPVILFLIWAIAAAGFGHYVNDCFDIRTDELSGKSNQAAKHSLLIRLLISISLAISACIPWLFLDHSQGLWIWVLSHLFLFILYSAPSIRLKEKGILGILADAVYAHVIPVYLAFQVMNGFISPDSLENQFSLALARADFFSLSTLPFLILFWSFFFGMRGIIGHQVQDFGKDLASGTRTFVTKTGQKTSAAIIHYFLAPPEIILFILIWSSNPEKLFYPLLLFFVFFIVWKIFWQLKIWKTSIRNDYGIPFLNSILNNFYEQWLPLILLGYLSWNDPRYLFVASVHLLLFQGIWRKV